MNLAVLVAVGFAIACGIYSFIKKQNSRENHLSFLYNECISPWCSHGLFRKCTGIVPSEYIRKVRLTMAAKKLKKESVRITDIVMDLGFGSIDGFTRAFFREFGMTPSEYKLSPVPITLFIPYGVKFKELRKEKRK